MSHVKTDDATSGTRLDSHAWTTIADGDSHRASLHGAVISDAGRCSDRCDGRLLAGHPADLRVVTHP